MQNTNTSVVGGHEDAMLALNGDGNMGGESRDTFWNAFLVDDACPLPTIGATPSFGLASGGGTLSGMMDMAPLVTAGPSMDLPTEVRPLPAPVADDVEGEAVAADSTPAPSPTDVADALVPAPAAPAAKRHAKRAKPVPAQRFKEKVTSVTATAVDVTPPLSTASGTEGDKAASARFLDMRDFDSKDEATDAKEDLDKPMSDTDVGALSDGGEGGEKDLDKKKKARILRNRESAANSRKRKRAQQQELEGLVASLKKTVETLQEENAELRRTVGGLVEEQSVTDFLAPQPSASDLVV